MDELAHSAGFDAERLQGRGTTWNSENTEPYSARRLIEATVSLLILGTFVCSLVWIGRDVVPRFNSSPVSAPLQHTVFSGYARPASSVFEPGLPVEIGGLIRPTVDGKIIGMRYYRLDGEPGPHVGSVWSRKGDLLATVPFADATGSGWQEATLPTPLEIKADQLIVVSYFSPEGGQIVSGTPNTASGITVRSPSTLFRTPPVAAAERPVNIYHLGESAFPTTDGGAQQFLVDVVFVPDAP